MAKQATVKKAPAKKPAVGKKNTVGNEKFSARKPATVQGEADKKALEFAKDIVDTVRESLLVLDAELRVILASRSFYQKFGVTPEETEGHLLYGLGNGQWDIPALRELLEEILPQNTRMDDFEVEHEFEHIGQRFMLLNARRIYRKKNNTERILLAIEDITERKLTEEALQKSLAELVCKERLTEEALQKSLAKLVRKERLAVLGQLSGGLGHELRNPMGVISNAVYYLNIILSDADETAREYLGIISSEIHNAEKIVSGLLDLSRSRPAKQEEVAVSALVAQVLQKQPPPENVKVTTEMPADLPSVLIDPGQIAQVLINLVTNACQAMPEGGKLIITADESTADDSIGNPKSEIRIHISDSGCGIPEDTMTKLFEPLFTTKARGIGLGLSVSRNLAEVNGGTIAVVSEVGKGSTFTVTLPTRRR